VGSQKTFGHRKGGFTRTGFFRLLLDLRRELDGRRRQRCRSNGDGACIARFRQWRLFWCFAHGMFRPITTYQRAVMSAGMPFSEETLARLASDLRKFAFRINTNDSATCRQQVRDRPASGTDRELRRWDEPLADTKKSEPRGMAPWGARTGVPFCRL